MRYFLFIGIYLWITSCKTFIYTAPSLHSFYSWLSTSFFYTLLSLLLCSSFTVKPCYFFAISYSDMHPSSRFQMLATFLFTSTRFLNRYYLFSTRFVCIYQISYRITWFLTDFLVSTRYLIGLLDSTRFSYVYQISYWITWFLPDFLMSTRYLITHFP